ncbi:hypothetical protein HNR47_002307 [Methylopila jiangsuensis]|nr:Hint domain-containing protein [Methylopila jiangsuensis]MDR6286306.1 hypothetical protein [Methylopila jiangsuensis]
MSASQNDFLTDNDGSDTVFSVGENLDFSSGSAGLFEGVTTIGDHVYVVVSNPNDPSQIALAGPSDPGADGGPGWPQTIDPADINAADFATCFAAGAPIATPHGERAVETLAIGDLILTADGRAVPVKWVGRQTVHRVFTPEFGFRPVRIRAGALDENVPHADLVVTSDHGMLIDDLVVQAGALVNDRSITRVPYADLPEQATYFHIETENHEAILAAGAPAETFVDNVTRRRFDNHAEYAALYDVEAYAIEEMDRPRVKAARQLPAAIRARLERRADAIDGASAAEAA